MLVKISEIDMKEFLSWANSFAFCNSGQHVCDRLATIFEGVPVPDQCSNQPDCNPKPLAQYLDEYIEHEVELNNICAATALLYAYNSWRELLEQALDAYQSTENVTIKIERNAE